MVGSTSPIIADVFSVGPSCRQPEPSIWLRPGLGAARGLAGLLASPGVQQECRRPPSAQEAGEPDVKR